MSVSLFLIVIKTRFIVGWCIDIRLIMGNIVDKIVEHKTETVLLGGVAAALFYLNKERQEKEQLRALLKSAIESKLGVKEFENSLNQVYLKDNVEHQSIRNVS